MSSTRSRRKISGRRLVPIPGMNRGAGAVPKVTEPTASTAMIRVPGECRRKWWMQPIRVPEVPVPTNRKSTSGISAVIAAAVRRSCTSEFAGFAYWLSQTSSGSAASRSWM